MAEIKLCYVIQIICLFQVFMSATSAANVPVYRNVWRTDIVPSLPFILCYLGASSFSTTRRCHRIVLMLYEASYGEFATLATHLPYIPPTRHRQRRTKRIWSLLTACRKGVRARSLTPLVEESIRVIYS